MIAGGQSLMPMMAYRLATPSLLVDLRKLEGLDRIDIGKDGVRLGAKVRWRDILDSEELRKAHPLLVAAIEHVAHYQIRNRGTVGGSLAHADPAAEMPGIAVACDALIAMVGKAGTRVVRAADFFLGALTTVLQPDEIITEVRLPLWPAARRWGFEEFARRRGDFALGAVAVFYDQDGLDRAKDVHIGVIGASNRPRRIKDAEAVLNGRARDGGADRRSRTRRVGRRRSAGRHPRERCVSPGARGHADRARADARRRSRAMTQPREDALHGQRQGGRGRGAGAHDARRLPAP